MNKSRNYLIKVLLAFIGACIVYCLVLSQFSLSPIAIGIIGITNLFIFATGSFIVAPSLDKDAENFVGKFMILTTVQLLLALSIIAAIIFKKFPQMKELSLNFIGLFVLLLIFQSFWLIKFTKSKSI